MRADGGDVTRTEYLQRIVDNLTPADDFLTVEFIPFRGWHLCGEPRWIEDSGKDFIGRDWREAEKVLRKTFGPLPLDAPPTVVAAVQAALGL